MIGAKTIFSSLLLLTSSVGLILTEAALSLPPRDGTAAAATRAAAIADLAKQISNGPRNLTIAGVNYPLYYGPKPILGSLTAQIQQEEIKKLLSIHTIYPEYVASLAANMSTSFTSMESFAAFYEKASPVIEKPMSMDISDETFGLQRHTIKSYALRQAKPADLGGKQISLSGFQLVKICGVGGTSRLFVENFSNVGQYTDPAHPNKYVPNVVGFFCVNSRTNQLVPVEIRLVDTKLTYTPFDFVDDWTLAKMALETSSIVYHQMAHMAETHAVTIPLRVELFRNMGADHPVRALLMRHIFADFGLENLAAVMLLNRSTPLDNTFGWGATGSTRFLYDHTQAGQSVKHQAFPRDVEERGLHLIPNHKYVTIGTMYWDAIRTFVDAFLDVYYKADRDVVNDHELQSWAKASALIPHIRDFPTCFQSKGQVRELLTHLIFSSTVKHHGMNGIASWHGTTAPYSHAALWKPLPTTKGKSLNLFEFTLPVKLFPSMLYLAASFHRPVPEEENMFSAYKVEPFTSESGLQRAIATFDNTLKKIEKTIDRCEAGAKWPYLMLRPSLLPYYTWV